MDLAPYGVTANAVSPGSTRTAILDASATVYGLESVEEFASQQPIGRLLEPSEIAAAIVWLCSAGVLGDHRRRHGGRRRDDGVLSPLRAAGERVRWSTGRG